MTLDAVDDRLDRVRPVRAHVDQDSRALPVPVQQFREIASVVKEQQLLDPAVVVGQSTLRLVPAA